MAEDFAKSVELGLKLTKRLYYGKEFEPSTKPPKRQLSMDKSSLPSQETYLPTSPMVYASISNPGIVDNPDVRSYQPYVHGKCKPPALIPLHMFSVKVDVECFMDVAFVTVNGTWRVHCVDGAKTCDCRLAIPMGNQILLLLDTFGHSQGEFVGFSLLFGRLVPFKALQLAACLPFLKSIAVDVNLRMGSVLGFDVEASSGSYLSQLVKVEDTAELNVLIKEENGGYLNPNIFILKIPKVDGGSTLTVKARWSQKLTYSEGQLCLSLPFRFPTYVTPVGQFLSKETIIVNVNSCTRTEALCSSATHPLKELSHGVSKLSFSYESKADTWSKTDFEFSYRVSSKDIHGGMLVQTPPSNDLDRREIFTFYMFPGYSQDCRVFRKRAVFLVDISGSMAGAPLENVKQAVLGTLSKFSQNDYFNIIAFNRETYMFSSSMELATQEALERASEWFSSKLVAEGDTDIMLPMKQALEMVSHEDNSISFVFLVTDGAVENEIDICNMAKDSCMKRSAFPRISTFGIGSYCNHYFLQMLAQIGKGHYDSAYDAASVALRLQRFLTVSSSVILSNIEVDCLEHAESLALNPASTQDLSYERPLLVSGRYKGRLPESFEVRATLADMSSFTTNLKRQEAKNIPLDKVNAQTQINVLTAEAWFTGSKEVEKQVAEISMQTGFPSEYTRMILARTESGDQGSDFITIQGKEAYDQKTLSQMVRCKKLLPLQSLGIGFGDLKKTVQNLPPGVTVKDPDATDKIFKAATGCCHQFLDRFCCMCFIQALSTVSDRFVITLSQIVAALSCCECLACCYDLCDNCT
ncbi:hypothetical protein KSS87_008177 [Heliosperma pusillum]|nr:hypothetical protein KSS87_008177 [Heliosperma pusillum]